MTYTELLAIIITTITIVNIMFIKITGESKWARHDVHGVVGHHEGDVEGQIRAEDSDVHRSQLIRRILFLNPHFFRLPNRYEHSLHLLSRGTGIKNYQMF